MPINRIMVYTHDIAKILETNMFLGFRRGIKLIRNNGWAVKPVAKKDSQYKQNTYF